MSSVSATLRGAFTNVKIRWGDHPWGVLLRNPLGVPSLGDPLGDPLRESVDSSCQADGDAFPLRTAGAMGSAHIRIRHHTGGFASREKCSQTYPHARSLEECSHNTPACFAPSSSSSSSSSSSPSSSSREDDVVARGGVECPP
jgi:hypothetical protein